MSYGWTNKVLHRANRTLDELARRQSDLRDNDRQLVDEPVPAPNAARSIGRIAARARPCR